MEKEVKKEVQWKKEPADKDYPNAVSYLTLLFSKVSADWYGKRLQRCSHERIRRERHFQGKWPTRT